MGVEAWGQSGERETTERLHYAITLILNPLCFAVFNGDISWFKNCDNLASLKKWTKVRAIYRELLFNLNAISVCQAEMASCLERGY